uniref:BTB/POZ domain-containing protein n=1 Tax=Noccaea caerulescens TaxID=107243 RepID=A0A1J3JHQ1_NOCCA
MDLSTATTTTGSTAANGYCSPRDSSIPSSFTKFNSALTAGLLNPMSPPPPLAMLDKTRSSPTLFEMMASEADTIGRVPVQIQNGVLPSSSSSSAAAVAARTTNGNHLVISAQDKQALAMQRISDLLVIRSPGNQFKREGNVLKA